MLAAFKIVAAFAVGCTIRMLCDKMYGEKRGYWISLAAIVAAIIIAEFVFRI